MRCALVCGAAVIVSACGGGGGSGDGDVLPAPDAPTASSQSSLGSGEITWGPVGQADRYNLYIATEPGIDPDNYAAFDGAEMIADVASPYELSGLDLEPVYHAVVTAENEVGESGPSNEVILVPRYELSGETVIDRVSGLEWRRCAYGQTWSASLETCTGSPDRITRDEAQSLATDGWRMPAREEMLSIVFCANGEPAYFPGELDEPCDSEGRDPPAVWPPAFPSTPYEIGYHTDTVCSFDETWSIVSFSAGYYAFCDDGNALIYLRQARRAD